MKKGLLFLLGASMIAAPTFAQDDEPDRVVDSLWMADFDSAYSVLLDMTNRTLGIKDIILDEHKGHWTVATAATVTNDVDVVGNVLTIDHKRTTEGDNYADISFQTFDWRGTSGFKFPHLAEEAGETVDTLGGMFVDMEPNEAVTVSFKAKVTTAQDSAQIRVDLVDANGRQGNGKLKADYQNTQRVNIKPTDGWVDVNLKYAFNMFDYYSGAYWGSNTGMWDGVGKVIGGNKKPANEWGAEGTYLWAPKGDTIYKREIAQEEVIPVSNRTIGKIMFIVDDAKQGVVGEQVLVEIKDLVIGSVDKAVSYVSFDEATTTLAYNPDNAMLVANLAGKQLQSMVSSKEVDAKTITVYPNPATNVINVEGEATVYANGVAVATGNGTVDVSALKSGFYIVKTAKGSAVFTK